MSDLMPEPIGCMSPKQVPLIKDPDDESGHYIPMRRTPAGNFILALYTADQMREYAKQAIQAERAKYELYGIHVKPDGEHEVWIAKAPR